MVLVPVKLHTKRDSKWRPLPLATSSSIEFPSHIIIMGSAGFKTVRSYFNLLSRLMGESNDQK